MSPSLAHITIYNQPDCILPKSFFEGRFKPNVHPESLDYEQWWNEQIDRCEHGWNDGGFHVTGVNYYHLNFKKINMVDVATETILMANPYFSYEDQDLFNEMDDARKKGEGIMLITGRGWGKSYGVSSLVEHEFTFKDTTEIIVSASTDRFADLLWEKIEIGMNSQPSEIQRSMLINGPNEKQSGYSEKDPRTKKFVDFDNTAFIRKVAYDHDPEKTRGTRPSIHIWEEVGSWTGAAGLLDCLRKTEPSWRRGRFKTTFPIFIGTGGAMDTGGSIDAKLMFESPKSYGLREYVWDDKPVGKFYPAYVKYGGCYERSGKSDDVLAKAILDKEREEKKADPEAYRQFTSEFPYNPAEAFQTSGSGELPIDLLERQYIRIERDPKLKKMVQRGFLDFKYDGSKIVGVEWRQDDQDGIFEILEHPEWTKKDWAKGIINNLYTSGCDSFDSVAENAVKLKKKGESKRHKKSRGAHYIFKRFFNSSITSRVFVAKIVQRTDDATDFYWNTLKLNMYYNCKMLVEYTKIGILQHYITTGYEHWLHKRPVLDKVIIKDSSSTNTYGVAMPGPVKGHVIGLYRNYIRQSSDQMFFTSQLRDAMLFTFEGYDKNEHDETMAASIALLSDDDMYKVKAKEQQKSTVHFPKLRRNAYGQLVFD